MAEELIHLCCKSLKQWALVMCTLFCASGIMDAYGVDPCLPGNHIIMNEQENRSTAYVTETTECDRRLTEGWYRVRSRAGEDMPTTCPQQARCNTLYPLWMNGPIPANDSQIHNRTVNIRYEDDCQFIRYQIKVKNCGDFRVYLLAPLSECPAAYCFGDGSPCTEGHTSDTGYTPCWPVTETPTGIHSTTVLESGKTERSTTTPREATNGTSGERSTTTPRQTTDKTSGERSTTKPYGTTDSREEISTTTAHQTVVQTSERSSTSPVKSEMLSTTTSGQSAGQTTIKPANPSSTVANDPTSSDPASPTPPGTNDSSSFSVYILVSAIVSPIITVITCIAFGLFAYFVMKKRRKAKGAERPAPPPYVDDRYVEPGFHSLKTPQIYLTTHTGDVICDSSDAVSGYEGLAFDGSTSQTYDTIKSNDAESRIYEKPEDHVYEKMK